MPLDDGQVIVARSNGSAHSGAFKNVVFVVDDLKRPLHKVIYDGLCGARKSGLKTVCIPTIRMGVMLGVVEKNTDEAVSEMAKGVREFLTKHPEALENITFVVYNDSLIQALLEKALK